MKYTNLKGNNKYSISLRKAIYTIPCLNVSIDLYCSPNIVRVIKSRRIRWVGHEPRMGLGRGVYRVLVENSEGKRPLGRPRRRCEDNIKMDFSGSEVWGCGLDRAGSG